MVILNNQCAGSEIKNIKNIYNAVVKALAGDFLQLVERSCTLSR